MNIPRVYHYENKERFGVNCDGGYVIAKLDGDSTDGYDCYISCGVSNEESFTRDFLSKHSISKEHCYAFDGTIEDYPWSYTTNIQFFKKNIGIYCTDTIDNLHAILRKYKNVFVKMDIEGGEYPWIYTLPEDCLQNIRQMVIEYHGVMDNGWGADYQAKSACYTKMEKYHYAVHIHGNNHGGVYPNRVPSVIELAYVRKTDVGELPLNCMPLPTPGLDFPNRGDMPDIDLNGVF